MSLRLQKVLSSKYYVTPDNDLTIEQQKAITTLRVIATRSKGTYRASICAFAYRKVL